MIKQPIGMKFYTNISIVRLKLGKSRYEIACYKNKVQDWRDKKETDISEVLQTNTIFKNVIKGDIAPASELKSVFPKKSHEDIVKLILDKGVIQVGDKERTNQYQNQKRYIANIIVSKTYNTETGLAFPQDIIMKVLEEIEFNVDEKDDTKKQALKAIKEIIDKKILPLERKMIQLLIKIKNKEMFANEEAFTQFMTNFVEYVNNIDGEILDKNVTSVNDFYYKFNIKPNYYRDLLNKYDKQLSIEILSNEAVSTRKTYSNKQDEQQIEMDINKFAEMKIANANVDKYLDDNFGNENKKYKKQLTCTKCKGTNFEDQSELRQHYKTNWHKHNALLSAQGKESMSAEEYDEYVLMNPEALN